VYGVQSIGLETDAPLPTSVEQMADSYFAAIRHVQPRGPYRLAGWSMGCAIAFEVAARLENAGQRVEVLALIDGAPFDATERSSLLSAPWRAVAAEFVLDVTRTLGAPLPPVLGEPSAGVDELLASVEALGPGDWKRRFEVFAANRSAQGKWIPAHAVKCEVELLLAAEGLGSSTHPDAESRWRAWITGGLRTKRFPGDHYSVLGLPLAAALAPLLSGAE
jgi:thioesterase domain-containing protein